MKGRWLEGHRLCPRCHKLRDLARFRRQARVCRFCDRVARRERYECLSQEARLLYSARKRAKKKGLEFNLALEDIVIPERCPVLGIPMTQPSIDRFDSTRGYTPDNIRVISVRANTIKSDGTAEEIARVLAYVRGEKSNA